MSKSEHKPLVVITGAGSGIGKATAEAFAKEGHALLLLGRRIERIKEMNLPNAMLKEVDVTDVESIKQAVIAAEEVYGPTDCFVNNAGVMLLGAIENQDPKEWQTMLDVNVRGVLNGVQVALQSMIARKTGTIINVSSVAGKKTFPDHAAYCATKFGVHALTENVREEVAKHNVRMVTIAPGVVDTNLLSHTTSEDIKKEYRAWKEGLGQTIQPENIAAAMLYAYQQPQHICVREIVLATTTQEP